MTDRWKPDGDFEPVQVAQHGFDVITPSNVVNEASCGVHYDLQLMNLRKLAVLLVLHCHSLGVLEQVTR